MSYQHAANPAAEWERVQNPEASGWSEAGLQAVEACASGQETDALMIVQGAKVIYSYGDVTHKYLCHSIRKSILAALMGQDVADGFCLGLPFFADISFSGQRNSVCDHVHHNAHAALPVFFHEIIISVSIVNEKLDWPAILDNGIPMDFLKFIIIDHDNIDIGCRRFLAAQHRTRNEGTFVAGIKFFKGIPSRL